MRLFRRRKSSDEGFSEGQPVFAGPPPEQTVSRARIDWKRAIPRLIILIVILVGIVSGILWATGVIGKGQPADHDKKPLIAQSGKSGPSRKTESGKSTGGKPAPSTAPQDQAALKSPQSAGTAARPGDTSSPTTPSTAGTPATGATASTQSGALTNTGPGETAVIFVATTLIGSIAYQINLRRRLS